MTKKEIGNIPQIAQSLIGHLPKTMDDELKSLIAQAEAGQNVTTRLINLFSQHEVTSLWLKEQLDLQSRELGASGYSPLAGDPSRVPFSQKWVCPQTNCDHWFFVIQEGQAPPICEEHKVEMVRGTNEKG